MNGALLDAAQRVAESGPPVAQAGPPAGGDEVRQMLGLAQRQEIISRLTQRIRYDAMLFSGGGNDLVGDQFVTWSSRKISSATSWKISSDN